jgi:hypothetical protein
VFVHQQKQRHCPHVSPNTLELRRHVRVGSVEEECVHVDDVGVRRQIAEDLVLILELNTGLGPRMEWNTERVQLLWYYREDYGQLYSKV